MKKETAEQPVVAQSFPSTLPMKPMAASDFKAVKRLTRDLNSLTRLGQVLVCVQSDLYFIDMPDPGNAGSTRPVGALDCLDCLSGEEFTLVCGAVLTSTFKREKDPLPGRYFALRAGVIPPGKRYYKPEVVEIERTA